MYRKSMREALEEARAYTAVHEVKVSKGGRTLDISKDDLPVYKAKGWELTENVFQKIRLSNSAVEYARKLSSYAVRRGGIDRKDFMKIADRMSNVKNDNDMKKIGKLVDDMDTEPRDLIKGSIALQMGPKTYETMFGDRLTSSDMNQYRQMTPRDMREETDLVEFKRMSVFIPDPLKRAAAIRDISRFGGGTGFKIDVGSKTIKVDGKGKDLNKFATDLKNFYGAQIKAESIEEATVTIKSYDTKTGLDRQAEKQMNAVAQRAGAKVKKSGNNVYKVTGDGKQLSKFMANIDQIDGSFMTEESEFINEFTSAQIKRLKKEYEPLRGVHHTELQPARFTQLSKMMQRMGKPQLQALVKADIPVLSSAAKASLVVNHGMKFSSIKEELIPYLEVFPLDENRKSKFKSVAPEVINRIQKMMKGNREEKDSIANMLNYMMPPEVVDMVRDKLKITAKRGKIRF